MALDYGYTIRIQSNGSSDPSAVPTNQWQRKLSGQPSYSDIPGETGSTYLVNRGDQSSSIRLKQDFNGSAAYSNALSVTSSAPPAPPISSVTWERIPGTASGKYLCLKHSKDYSVLVVLETNYYNLPGSNALWYSEDGGETWTKRTMASLAIGPMWAIEGPNARTWYVRTLTPGSKSNEQLWIKLSNLSSWNNNWKFPTSKVNDSLHYVNGVLYATIADGNTNVNNPDRYGTARIMQSTNDGSTWTEVYNFSKTNWRQEINVGICYGDSMTYYDGWYYVAGTSRDPNVYGGKAYHTISKAQNVSGPWSKAVQWNESTVAYDYNFPSVHKMQGEFMTNQSADYLYTSGNPVTSMTKRAKTTTNYYDGYNYSKDKSVTFTILGNGGSGSQTFYTEKPSSGWQTVPLSGSSGKPHGIVEGNGRWIMATESGLWRSKN